jgi:hypothetical protein
MGTIRALMKMTHRFGFVGHPQSGEVMSGPLILGRRAPVPTRGAPALPRHHYDPDLCVNVTPGGTLLIHAVDSGTYTGTQEPRGYKKDD